jgi:hypothetical protein
MEFPPEDLRTGVTICRASAQRLRPRTRCLRHSYADKVQSACLIVYTNTRTNRAGLEFLDSVIGTP